jgi:hypothetical protein
LLIVLFADGGSARSGQPAADLLKVLPDRNGVIIVDVSRLLTSNFWSSLTSEQDTAVAARSFESGLNRLGVSMKDLNAAALAVRDIQMNEMVAAASGNFKKDEIVSRLKGNTALKARTEMHGGMEVITIDNPPEQIAITFFDPNILVMGKDAAVRSAIDASQGKTPSLVQNGKLQSALPANVEAPVRFAILTPPEIAGTLQSSSLPLPDFSAVRLITGTVEVTSLLNLNLTLRSDTTGDAKVIANQLNSMMNMARGLLGNNPKNAALAETLRSVAITSAEADVKIAAIVNKEFFARMFRK